MKKLFPHEKEWVILMNEIIFMIKDSIDGGFEAQAVGYSIFTEAETMEEIKNNIVEAVDCHFDEGEKPKLIRLHYVKEEIIAA